MALKAGRDMVYGFTTSVTDKLNIGWPLISKATNAAQLAILQAVPKNPELPATEFPKEANFNFVPIAEADAPNIFIKGVVTQIRGTFVKQE